MKFKKILIKKCIFFFTLFTLLPSAELAFAEKFLGNNIIDQIPNEATDINNEELQKDIYILGPGDSIFIKVSEFSKELNTNIFPDKFDFKSKIVFKTSLAWRDPIIPAIGEDTPSSEQLLLLIGTSGIKHLKQGDFVLKSNLKK